MFHRHSPYGKLIKRGGHPVSGIQPHPSNKSCHTVVYQMCRDDNTLEHFWFLGQNSHDDSFVAIGGVTRQRHDQWLRKPPVRRCTNVFGSLYVFRSKQSRWQLCRHWRCHETATRPVITKDPSPTLYERIWVPVCFLCQTVTMTALSPLAVSRDSDTTSDYESPQPTTLSSLAIPKGNGILNHQRVVTMTIIRCINVAVFMDLYFKITKVLYCLCVGDNFVVIGYTKRKRYPQPSKSCHHDDYALY